MCDETMSCAWIRLDERGVLRDANRKVIRSCDKLCERLRRVGSVVDQTRVKVKATGTEALK